MNTENQNEQTVGVEDKNPRRAARGFATMNAERQREIASQGGKAAHQKGTAHVFTSAEASAAGLKGGRPRTRPIKE